MASNENKKNIFQNIWTELYFFVQVRNGAFCLLCNSPHKIFEYKNKGFNYKRHFTSNHVAVSLQSDESRAELLQERMKLLESDEKYDEVMMIIEERAEQMITDKNVKIASYVVAYQIAKHSKPFDDGEFLKTCFSAVSALLCPESKTKFEQIALSRRSISRRIEKIRGYLNDQLKLLIKNAKCYSIALDESCDVKDIAQLCIFIRGITENFELFEELLSMQPMVGRTTGNDFFTEFMKCNSEYEIDIKKIVSVTTDGCPSMIGKNKGLVTLLKHEFKKESNIDLVSIHCLIHQEALCKNALKLEYVVKTITKFVNFIRGSPLRHREFSEFLKTN